MLDLYNKELLWYAEIFWFLVVFVCVYSIRYQIPGDYPSETEADEYSRRKWRSVCYAVLGGTIAANQNILFKSCGEILERTFGYSDSSAWLRWETYVLIGSVIFLSVQQLSCLNTGLAMWKASWLHFYPESCSRFEY